MSPIATIANLSPTLGMDDWTGGIVILVVGIVAFIAITGLALQMTIGASKSPGVMAITGISALLSVIIAIGLFMSLGNEHTVKGKMVSVADCPVSTWDNLGGTLGLIIGIVAALAVLGTLAVMLIGAFTPSKTATTSWPHEQEQAFQGFDRRAAGSQTQAWLWSVVSGVVVFVFAMGIYHGVEPQRRDYSKDMNMGNLTKKDAPAAAPAAAPPKAEAPAPTTAPAPATDPAAPAGSSATP